VATAAILGIAREAGETAPLLFTAFGYNLMNANPFSGAQESLPLFIYRFIREPLASSIARGFAGALVLMLLILLLFAIARIVGRDRTKARRRPKWSKRFGSLLRPPARPASSAQALAKEPS
jgi:phosphate transport system permease protein